MSDLEQHAALIRSEMRSIRSEARADLRTIAAQAKQVKKTLTDWRFYVRQYPLWCAAAAVGIGFLIVPRKQKLPAIDPAVLKSLLGERLGSEALTGKTKRPSLLQQAAIALATTAAKSLLQGGLATFAQQMQGFVGRRAAPQSEEAHDHD